LAVALAFAIITAITAAGHRFSCIMHYLLLIALYDTRFYIIHIHIYFARNQYIIIASVCVVRILVGSGEILVAGHFITKPDEFRESSVSPGKYALERS
jgi:hypothetical protein